MKKAQAPSRRLFSFSVSEMPDERRKEVHEALQDPDDHEAHQHPFGELREEAALDDLAEAEADDGNQDGGDHRRPNCYSYTEFLLRHRSVSYGLKITNLISYLTVISSSYSHASDFAGVINSNNIESLFVFRTLAVVIA